MNDLIALANLFDAVFKILTQAAVAIVKSLRSVHKDVPPDKLNL